MKLIMGKNRMNNIILFFLIFAFIIFFVYNSKWWLKLKEKEEQRLTNMLEIENRLYNEGYSSICGVDEAGRGPLCGPVVAAAVILTKSEKIEGVNDSKKLSEKKENNSMKL